MDILNGQEGVNFRFMAALEAIAHSELALEMTSPLLLFSQKC